MSNQPSTDADEGHARGRAARTAVPRSAHGEWAPADDRPDPVAIIEAQNETRVPWLVPVRHDRMRVSPFTFYRGAAAIMAADLSTTPDTGLTVQLGGDAHLSNFGAYASPGRQLVVDANDFDETLRGPWEWDLKRLATSVLIAAQHLGFASDDCLRVTDHTSHAYATAMAEYAQMGYLDVWNRLLTVDDLITNTEMTQAKLAKRIERFERRARRKDSRQAVGKLTETVDGRRQIIHDPPVLYPLRALPIGYEATEVEAAASAALDAYKTTLNDSRRFLLDRYSLIDTALKVVGVGSVGTRCFILLLEGRTPDDVFFLQAKEAQASVLEPFLAPSPYHNHGQRIVEGQRLSQAQSDIFLGWTEGRVEHHHFYLRQLRDWKGSVEIEGATPRQLAFYADLCGKTLARAHARTGDPVAISAYVGGGKRLARAMGEFGLRYAAQNLVDFEAFQDAIASGRLAVPESSAN